MKFKSYFNIKNALLSTLIICSTSCQDIFVPDIEEESVYLLSPPDSLITYDYIITFWWENVPDAEKYNLQLVSPSFDSIVHIIADTNLSNTKFENISLYPGEFEWRVSAYNSTSTTPYITRYFRIDSTESVSQVILISPDNNEYMNSSSVEFKWSSQEIADFYRYKLYLNDDLKLDENYETNSITLPEDAADISELNEGVYRWQVQAINDYSQSIFSEYAYTIDRTAPGSPVLTTPADNTTFSVDTVYLSWQRVYTDAYPLNPDSLYFFRDSLNTSPILNLSIADSSFTLINEGAGTYLWKVKSMDKAGNISQESEIRTFTITSEAK